MLPTVLWKQIQVYSAAVQNTLYAMINSTCFTGRCHLSVRGKCNQRGTENIFL
jgi:hypothetical protein